MISFLLFQTNNIALAHFSFQDTSRIIFSSFCSFIFLIITIICLNNLNFDTFILLFIHLILSSYLIIFYRFVFRKFYYNLSSPSNRVTLNTIIYGANPSSILTRSALLRDRKYIYNIKAFVSEDITDKKILSGVPILNEKKALEKKYLIKNNIDEFIFTSDKISSTRRNEIIEYLLKLQIKTRIVPTIDKWVNNKFQKLQIKEIEIEDLLGRDAVLVSTEAYDNGLKDKTIMVTGGAGSIGQEIIKQLISYGPKKIVVLDNAETPIFHLKHQLNQILSKETRLNIIFEIADICNNKKMKHIFNKYKINYVFHAAAYKHVPLMEENPDQAVRVNVFGSKLIADLSIEYNIEKFIFISTDKAINPTNVMGATKRIAEMYIQSLSNKNTEFITTRFGNVLGSNGSVINIFKEQIKNGGPITITDNRIIRYFMTSREACNLVIQAALIGNNQEILMFDMGNPVKIYDLAYKMIELSGQIPNRDIMIKQIGLRAGEKLYEELLTDKEIALKTHHPKILKAKTQNHDFNLLSKSLKKLENYIKINDNLKIVKEMKVIVPEFVSNNSNYSILD
tara:strand:- start:9776 stop:11473 length:1698 start_codon:yes stop_codon:yes gene_type:complete